MRILLSIAYLIVITLGLRYPILGTLVFSYMGLVIIVGKRKKWCSSYCPRGSFLDVMISRLSPTRPIPLWLLSKTFRRTVLVMFLGFFGLQLYLSGLFAPWPEDGLIRLGTVLVRMCILSSAIALPLAFWNNQRAWCSFCPVGNILRRIPQ
ncbi:MAG: FeS-binding protein [Synergistales bacterium]|nr:FeS-binding protein [Synergistales bacterium]